jgi:hypothetical protein
MGWRGLSGLGRSFGTWLLGGSFGAAFGAFCFCGGSASFVWWRTASLTERQELFLRKK